ncbi:unnamed protein product [Danaus chrysippus]|uniref:(African queen) hypothetical protein n=1 Tax=Danaus chrysippus TaxID=151541 RepID=A0A8J2VUS9_9NEOP|nr:unnamed protein product [Danaus chrysippus]
MPQLFQVLRCYKCLAFQVHHSKKSNKFLCKVCNEKQSIKRHYGVGIAKDCRLHVQKLNKLRGEKDNTVLESLEDSSEECKDDNTSENSCEDITSNIEVSKKRSKWLAYVDVDTTEAEENHSSEEDRESGKYNARRQNKNMYTKYKRKRKSSIPKQDSDTELESSYIENDIQRDKSDLNTSYERKLITTDMNSTLRDNDSINDNVNPIKRPKFEPPVVARTSKWANFIEEDENIENITQDDKDLTHNIQPMFSLCDESDIDDVLNI